MSLTIDGVANPRFFVPGLGTTAPTIVARRRVKIPPSNPTNVYTGARNPNTQTSQNSIYWDIADNESFIDMERTIFVMDLTFHCFKEIAPTFDQNSNAIIARFVVGNAQGMRIEEIDHYNLVHNMTSIYTQTAQHKERSLMDYSDFDKTVFKPADLNPYLDSVYYLTGQSAVTPEHPFRVHFRIHESSFFKNMRILPTFLFRNGVRFEIYLENVYRSFCLQSGPDPSRALVFPTRIMSEPQTLNTNELNIAVNDPVFNQFNWFPSPGMFTTDGNDTVRARNIAAAGANLAYNYYWWSAAINDTNFLKPYVNGVRATKKCYSILNVGHDVYRQLNIPYMGLPVIFDGNGGAFNNHAWYAVPVSFVHHGVTVWTGLAVQRYDTMLPSDWVPYNHDAAATRNFNFPLVDTGAYNSTNLSVLAPFHVGNGTGFPKFQNSGATTDVHKIAYDVTLRGLNRGKYFHFFLISQHPESTPPPYYFNSTTPADDVKVDINPGNSMIHPTMNLLKQASAQLVLYPKDSFYIIADETNGNVVGVQGGNQGSWIPPLVHTWYRATVPQWDYTIRNPEMILDLLKPAAEDFSRFQQMFLTPNGINYKFKKILYQKKTFTPQKGQLSVSMNMALRSMTGALLCIQDVACDSDLSDTTRMLLPHLSSFFKRGLDRVEIVVGGQVYPGYPVFLKPNNTNFAMHCEAHIPETENFFSVSGSGSFNPSFSLARSRYTRAYSNCGLFGQTLSSILAIQSAQQTALQTSNGQLTLDAFNLPNENLYADPQPPCTNLPYLDTSAFIMGFALQRDDVNPFGTGLDTSQAGMMILNLYFNDPGYNLAFSFNRQFDLHLVVFADAIFTKQNDGDGVRQ